MNNNSEKGVLWDDWHPFSTPMDDRSTLVLTITCLLARTNQTLSPGGHFPLIILDYYQFRIYQIHDVKHLIRSFDNATPY